MSKPIQSTLNDSNHSTSSPGVPFYPTSIPTSTDEKHFESDRGKFVMFYSPKGGVGKTSLAINCALQFAMKNLKVLLIDYSLFGSVRIKLKIDIHNPGLASILPAVRTYSVSEDIEALISQNICNYKFGNNYSLDVLPADSPVNMSKLSTETVEFINNVISGMDYDVVIMDTSSNISPLNTALSEISKDIIILSSPEPSCSWALIQHKEIIHHLNLVQKCKLVVNMFEENTNFLPSTLAKELEYPLLTAIPFNNQVKIIESSSSFVSLNSNDPFNIYYRQMAHNIIPVFGSDDIKHSKKKFSLNIFK